MFLDIETIPADQKHKVDLLDIYNRKIEKNPKETLTFEEYLEKTGLDGSFGQICCFGWAIDDQPAVSLDGDEKKMLQDFWQAAARVNLFVGFNIIDFDMRFIYQRSIILGVRPTQDLSFARYRSSPMYDVMKEWDKWGMNRISLHALSKALGLKSSKEGDIEGKDVGKAFLAGRIADICTYCKADVELTREIYKKMIFTE